MVDTGQQDFAPYSAILDHQGLLKNHDLKYKGSLYNVLVDWDDGTQTWEPLNIIGKQDPMTLARYAHDNGMLNIPGWKFLQHTMKHEQFINVILQSMKQHTDPNQVKHKFGIRIPRNYSEALLLDNTNGSTFWEDSICRELDQLYSYHTFHDLGIGDAPGVGYKKIKVRFVFDTKADGRRKGRLVAQGNMKPEPKEAVHSSVAALHSLRIIVFLAELNGLKLMQGDIGNAYLESYTQEKVYFVAGPEFGHKSGHTFIIEKALYGLCSSRLCFHEKLSSILRGFHFKCSHISPDVWLHDAGEVWEYIVVYVDDIIDAMKDTQGCFDKLQGPSVGFTMKGVGIPTYHIGTDFFRDDDGTLCLGAQTYSKRLVDSFE